MASGPPARQADETPVALSDETPASRVPASQPALSLPPQIGALAFSPDGKVLAAGSLHVVELINPTDGSVIRRLDGHMENVRALAFSGDGTQLAAAGGQPSLKGEVKIWKVADGSLVSTITG